VRVLAVAAHPDDVELLCAGTLARAGRAGHELWVAHMTVGDKGGQRPPEELARIRGEEADQAAELIGARTFGGICGDLELYERDDHRARVRDILADVRPDVVLTHTINDYHPDHRITSRLVASEMVAIGTDRSALLYMDTVGGVDFVPELYSDITETVEVKKRMLRCHASQIDWMASYRATDMEYLIEWLGRWRGLECGAPYAEGFRPDVRFTRPDLTQLVHEPPLAATGASA
jgi:LmbE family N-acetylglucosaminyl deacetylase